MQTILSRLRKLKANSFTLVELLVVISIIGLLAGLAVPAIQGGLDKAKQQVDVSNIRQCGLIAFGYANDNEGAFFGTNTPTKSKDYFTNLIAAGLLTSTKILSGNGYPAATNTNSIEAKNIAWAVYGPLTTSDDGAIPLFLSKNTPSQLQEKVTLSGTNSWKNKGLVVYRIGNSAEFIRAKEDKSVSLGTTNFPTDAKVYSD